MNFYFRGVQCESEQSWCVWCEWREVRSAVSFTAAPAHRGGGQPAHDVGPRDESRRMNRIISFFGKKGG